MAPHHLTREVADTWVTRWELQQQLYATARAERFHVIAETVAHSVRHRHRPTIADLGCGPGSLAAHLADRLPHAHIVGLDSDPLLLALGRARHGSVVDFVDSHIGSESWTDDLPVPLDAVVSTTALHYLPPEVLFTVYEEVHALLRPGGLLLNADHLFQGDPAIRSLAAAVGQGHTTHRGQAPAEDWHSWWEDVAAREEFRELLRERDRRGLGPGSDNGLTARQHTELMRKAGFDGVGSVWQYGHSCVLAAVRG